MNKVSDYASLVKFSHTIFAMPFALLALVYALVTTGTPFDWLLLVKVLVCMVSARNAAMGFNRWLDRDIDAQNPRTAGRDIPAGRISPRAAMTFVVVNCVVFVLAAWWINTLALALSPVALVVLLGYSATKRFTSLAHLVLGLALGIAPVGAYIAVTGTFAAMPCLLTLAVMTWTAGFDILYSMQDVAFDRSHALHSIPARFSLVQSTFISLALHVISLIAVAAIGVGFGFGWWYWIGTALFAVILVVQHVLYRPSRIDRIGATFGLVNGLASVTYALFAIIDLLVR